MITFNILTRIGTGEYVNVVDAHGRVSVFVDFDSAKRQANVLESAGHTVIISASDQFGNATTVYDSASDPT